ncbi:phospholipase A1-like [Anthonomus grandis grandis]|uniref:phospholipase A1-like n=1 Tax=Anthonomus grandis grandis TaxID=2921223 RepID=UPI00216605A6|nr:phospholipase A1-like [Anthonomus grandis grandis]
MVRIQVWLAVLIPIVLGGAIPDLSTVYRTLDTSDYLTEIYYLNNLTAQYEQSEISFDSISLLTRTSEDNDDVSFQILNRANSDLNQNITISQIANITSLTSFDIDLPTFFLIHGWRNDINSTVNFIISETLLSIVDANVIVVDWDDLSDGLYVTAYNKVPHVGKVVGQFILALEDMHDYSIENVQLIGHSLGAHICGYAGQETNGAIKVIVGLDPAGPLFLKLFPDRRLSEDDAQHVQVIHSCAGVLGVDYNVGHADFWPNGGHIQPGCSLDVSCYHGRSYYYFNESLTSSLFMAKTCGSYTSYTKSKCEDNAFVIMGGLSINTTLSGTFYLETNSSSPYALGDIGL